MSTAPNTLKELIKEAKEKEKENNHQASDISTEQIIKKFKGFSNRDGHFQDWEKFFYPEYTDKPSIFKNTLHRFLRAVGKKLYENARTKKKSKYS